MPLPPHRAIPPFRNPAMHFVGCARPVGTLETAPRAALLPIDLVGPGGTGDGAATTWESYWDADGRYLVRAVTGTEDAWFSLVDEPEATQAGAARLTQRSVPRVPPVGRRLVFVGARRRAASHGDVASPEKRSLVLVAKRSRAARRSSGC